MKIESFNIDYDCNRIHAKDIKGENIPIFRPLDEHLVNQEVATPSPQEDNFTNSPSDNENSIFKSNSFSRIKDTEKGKKDEEFKPLPSKWTVLVYFNGNCDLEPDMKESLNALEKVGSDDKIQLVAQFAHGDKGGKTERIHLKKPSWMGLKTNSEIEDIGKTNMAHPQTLKDFVTWGMKKFPAQHYMLILNGHGMGFVGSLPDDHADDIMLTSELKSAMDSAVKETGKKLDVVGFDSCLMANAETAYALKDSADFLVGSQEVLISGNWDYKQLASNMKEKVNSTEGLTVSNSLEELMKSQQNYKLLTTSIIDCRDMPGFAEKLKNFSEKLLNTQTPPQEIRRSFRNAQHYCQPKILEKASNSPTNTSPMDQMRDVVSVAYNIITNDNIGDTQLKQSALEMAKFVKEQVVIFEMHRKNMGLSNSNGISIYAPTSSSEKYRDYYQNKIDLSNATRWGEVIKKFSA